MKVVKKVCQVCNCGKVLSFAKGIRSRNGCRELLIRLCQTYEVLEILWVGELFSLEHIQIFFLSDSIKKSASLKKGQKFTATVFFSSSN